jgi:hypothetical protein
MLRKTNQGFLGNRTVSSINHPIHPAVCGRPGIGQLALEHTWLFVVASLLALSPSTAMASSVPEWLRAAAQSPVKHYPDDVNEIELLSDTAINVKDKGEIVTRHRLVFKVLRPEGIKSAQTYVVPFDGETKVNYLKGWSITAKGQEYEAKDKDTAEVNINPDELYSDRKSRVITVPGADIGSVIGFEYEQKERPYVFQMHWSFQLDEPVEHSRYELRLPSGWEYRADWVNHAALDPVEQNGAYVWQLDDISRIEEEYSRPPYRALAGRMVVTLFAEKVKNQTYKTWNDFGIWYGQLTAGAREPSPELQRKVQELAPASLPLLDRIRALARFAQRDVRYAAIEIGIGGYKPHQASEIFAHRYGDCKDKATVLGSMLSQIGVKSYYVLVHTNRGIFTEKSPPDMGFNHAIIAIQLPDASFSKPLPALYEHTKLGHLLIFDPTQELVPFGQIPYYEQDNFGLLVTEQGGELLHLPLSQPELNRVVRTARLNLLADGTLKGEVEEVQSGTEAYIGRSRFGRETVADRKKALERILGRWVSTFQLDSVDAENLDDIDRDLVLRYKFTAEHYAKNAGPLLLVRPRVLDEKAGYMDSSKPRHYAYEFEGPTLQTDIFEITLPEGYKVDELPEPAKATFSFGEYTSKTENSGTLLKYSREFKIKGTLVPKEQIADLKKFFSQINLDEKNMAILKKGN